jgi:hypothetical protein
MSHHERPQKNYRLPIQKGPFATSKIAQGQQNQEKNPEIATRYKSFNKPPGCSDLSNHVLQY